METKITRLSLSDKTVKTIVLSACEPHVKFIADLKCAEKDQNDVGD